MAWPDDWASGEKISETRLNGWMAAIKAWGGNIDTGGYSLIITNSAPVDANIPNKGVVIWIDESSNQLKFRLRYAGGTLKTGVVSLS